MSNPLYGSRRQNDALIPNPKPTAQEVEDFHTNADTDVRPESLHHTLGPGPGQAAAGNHTHNGSDSPMLLDGVILVGSRGGNAALASVVAALVQLGASDNTTP